jgi:hypothetical protein
MLETESVQSETARNFSRLFNESGYTTSEGDWTFTFDNGFILDRDDEQIDGLAYVGEWAVADGKVTVAQFERFYCPTGGWTPKRYWSRVRGRGALDM